MTRETIIKWRLNDFTKSGFANLIRPFENSLNDVIEKGNQNKSITEEQIKKESSEYIYNMVRALTKPKMMPGQREKLLNEYFQSIRSASEAVRYVKLADELDNMRSLKNSSHKDKIMRYKQDAQRYIVPIAQHTDERLLFKLSIAIYELK